MWISLCCAAYAAQPVRPNLCGPTCAAQPQVTKCRYAERNRLISGSLRRRLGLPGRAFWTMLSSPSYLEKMTLAVRESAQLPPKRVEPHPILGQIPYTGPRSPDASVE